MALERTVVLVGSLTVLCFLFALKALYGGVSAGIDPQHVVCDTDLTELKTRNEQQKVKYQQLAEQIHQLEVRVTSPCGDGDVQIALHTQHLAQGHHQLAVIVPYRDRESHLARLVLQLDAYLTAQGRNFTIFIIEQSQQYLFNRGALLNTAVQLLQASHYDYFAFQDVDTIPRNKSTIQYSYPAGDAPLHLTPFRIHPAANFQDFFGGITVFTREQIRRVNGFGTNFWGWGREDDNMRHRLLLHGMFPPELPNVTMHGSRHRYFEHQRHSKALEWRVKGEGSQAEYFGVNPDVPYGDARIISAQLDLLEETQTGLNTTRYFINNIQAYGNAVKYTVQLHCDEIQTPWCNWRNGTASGSTINRGDKSSA